MAEEENTAILKCSLVFSAGITLTRPPGNQTPQPWDTFGFGKGRANCREEIQRWATHSGSGHMDVSWRDGRRIYCVPKTLFFFTTHYRRHVYFYFSVLHRANRCIIQSDIFFISPDCQTRAFVQVKPDQTETQTKPRSKSLLRAVFCFNVITAQCSLLVCSSNSTETASSLLQLPL